MEIGKRWASRAYGTNTRSLYVEFDETGRRLARTLRFIDENGRPLSDHPKRMSGPLYGPLSRKSLALSRRTAITEFLVMAVHDESLPPVFFFTDDHGIAAHLNNPKSV